MDSIEVKLEIMPDCAIRNLNFEDFLNLFKTASLDISNFWLINSGYNTLGTKLFTHLVIRACQSQPFSGPHLITVRLISGELETFWVNSLTFVRRTIFKFTDRLSFERSTYLIPCENGELLIRIKSVRSLLIIPQMDWDIKQPSSLTKRTKYCDLEEVEEAEEIVNEEEREEKAQKIELTDNVKNIKMSSILNTYMQTMITYIAREKHLTTKQSVKIIKEYSIGFCDNLDNKL